MADDRGLLERLNALKPSSVTLDMSTNALNVSATGIQPAEPLSREDALSKRLQTLRNRREDAESEDHPHAQPPPPPYTETAEGTPSRKRAEQVTASSVKPTKQGTATAAAGPGETSDLRPDEDDQALDEILAGLDVEDDQWSLSDNDADDTTRVEELLAKLKVDAGTQPPGPSEGGAKDPANQDADDDSEGEEMSRSVENVISQAMDELAIDGITNPTDQDTDNGEAGDNNSNGAVATNAPPKNGDDDGDITLPTVPQDVHDRGGVPASLPRTPEEGDETGLSLPTVPTKLVDPAPAPGTSTNDPFESSIAARLAALKGASAVQTDAFGLPSAPTFQPEERPVAGVVQKPGYTDEDQKTWCIVCLEDGTVRCLGCDGDVYCARCWREMHVGPSAGYDERGHQWEKFDRRRL